MLTLTTGQAAAVKKQKVGDDEKSKTEPGPLDSTTETVQIGNLKGTRPFKEGLGRSDSGPHSARGGSKRKSTMTPIDGAKKAQKTRRR